MEEVPRHDNNERSAAETAEQRPEVVEQMGDAGDTQLAAYIDDYKVFAYLDDDDKVANINFGLAAEVDSRGEENWMATETGRGAYKTTRAIRPAAEALIEELERRGYDWYILADRQRAALYNRYLPGDKIWVWDKPDDPGSNDLITFLEWKKRARAHKKGEASA